MPPSRALWSVLDSAGPLEICQRCLKRARKASRDQRRLITNTASRPARLLRWGGHVSRSEYWWPNLAVSGSSYLPLQLEAQPSLDNPMSKRQYFWPNVTFAGLSTTIRGKRVTVADPRSGFAGAVAQFDDQYSKRRISSAIADGTDKASAVSPTLDTVHVEAYSSASAPFTQTTQGSRISGRDSHTDVAAEEKLPHHRRKKRRREEAAPAESRSTENYTIPPDASSRLTTASAEAPASSWRRKLALYLSLSKPRLSFLIVLTTAAPYCIYPTPDLLSPAITATPSLSALTLLFLTTGTALSSASANTFNMLFEPKYDAQMSRTRNRPLVRKLISSRAAALFGILSGCAGVTALYFGCNPTTSFLGAANIVLYAAIYTPMKRISVINTWVGALVGAIPPLMGWTAAAGQYAAEGGWRELLFTEQALGGWLLAALLFAWQFPHFNALSHTIRHEYANAGYRMLCSLNPARNARVALRYSVLMFPICYGLATCGIVGGGSAMAPTTILWAAGSTATNGWMSYQAVRFWWWQGAKGTARSLFWASVWHLPVLLVLAMALKRGIWQRMAEAVGLGASEEELDEDVALLEETAKLEIRKG